MPSSSRQVPLAGDRENRKPCLCWRDRRPRPASPVTGICSRPTCYARRESRLKPRRSSMRRSRPHHLRRMAKSSRSVCRSCSTERSLTRPSRRWRHPAWTRRPSESGCSKSPGQIAVCPRAAERFERDRSLPSDRRVAEGDVSGISAGHPRAGQSGDHSRFQTPARGLGRPGGRLCGSGRPGQSRRANGDRRPRGGRTRSVRPGRDLSTSWRRISVSGRQADGGEHTAVQVAESQAPAPIRAKAGMLRVLALGHCLALGLPGSSRSSYTSALERQLRDFPGDPTVGEARWRSAGWPPRAPKTIRPEHSGQTSPPIPHAGSIPGWR